jgi:hypothetical protein
LKSKCKGERKEEEVLPQYRVEKKKKKYCHNTEWKRRRRSTATIQSGKEEEEVLPQSRVEKKKKKYCHKPEWKRRRRSTATIRVEKNKDKHLHDMIQNYSSGEISHEQYI